MTETVRITIEVQYGMLPSMFHNNIDQLETELADAESQVLDQAETMVELQSELTEAVESAIVEAIRDVYGSV